MWCINHNVFLMIMFSWKLCTVRSTEADSHAGPSRIKLYIYITLPTYASFLAYSASRLRTVRNVVFVYVIRRINFTFATSID
jgi:hypothetical protein